MFKLMSSWPPARVEGGVRVAADDTRLAGCRSYRGCRGCQGCVPNRANSLFFTVLGDSGDTPVRCPFFLPWTSHLKRLLLIVFWEDSLPEVLSNVCVLAKRAMKKVTKTSHDSSMELSCNVFLFMTAPSKTHTLESISYF